MKKTWKLILGYMMFCFLITGLFGCNKKENSTTAIPKTDVVTTTEEGDPDYNVEDDLVDGILTEEMLDQLIAEEAAATEKEETTEETTEKPKTENFKKYYLKVNRNTNVVTVYTHDGSGNYTKPVKAMVCSVGRDNLSPIGKFKISTKHRWQLMFGGTYTQYATRISGHYLFHSISYKEPKNNTLIADMYNYLGGPASAGCIRLTCGDAYWIYNNCASGTTVELFNGSSADDPLGKPSAMKLAHNGPYSNWDPTDPDSANPWKTAKPVITADNFTVELGSGKVDLAGKASVKDAYGNTLTPAVSGNVDSNKVGVYSVTYTATDNRGNSEKKTITVTVKDTTAPSITTSLNGKAYTGERTATAVSDYVKKNTTVSDASGNASVTDVKVNIAEAEGKISCTITAKDGSGNTATATLTMTFEVVVPDEPTTETPPTTEEKPETPPTTEEKPETPPTTEEKPETPPSSEDVSTEENTSTDVTPTLEEGTNPEEGQDL